MLLSRTADSRLSRWLSGSTSIPADTCRHNVALNLYLVPQATDQVGATMFLELFDSNRFHPVNPLIPSILVTRLPPESTGERWCRR